MRSKIVLAAALVGAALTYAGGAAAHDRSGGKWWRTPNANKDITIGRAETLAAPGRRFTRLDRDRDGRISRAEFLALADRRFAAIDRNGDGRITVYELYRAKMKQEKRRLYR